MPEVRAESIANLKEAKRILDELGIPFCLFLGTALGAWRDLDFCPEDEDDIDLAITNDHYNRRGAIIEAFEKAGFIMKEYQARGAISPEIAFIKEHGSWHTKVDLFFVVPQGSQMIWTFYTPEAQNRATQRKFFDLYQEVLFFGEAYNIPFPIEQYLKDNYGALWYKPIPRSEWQWDKDNKCDIV